MDPFQQVVDASVFETEATVGVNVASKSKEDEGNFKVNSEEPVVLNPRLSFASSVGMGLDDLFCETVIRLHCFWDEMGMVEEDRETHVANLRARLDDALATSIATERNRVSDMKKQIDGAAGNILEMAKQLDIEADLVRSLCCCVRSVFIHFCFLVCLLVLFLLQLYL